MPQLVLTVGYTLYRLPFVRRPPLVGFAPMDLLLLSDHEQDVIRFLINHPGASVIEIAKSVQLSRHQIEHTLQELVREARLVMADHNGQETFVVNFTSDKQRTRTNVFLPDLPS